MINVGKIKIAIITAICLSFLSLIFFTGDNSKVISKNSSPVSRTVASIPNETCLSDKLQTIEGVKQEILALEKNITVPSEITNISNTPNATIENLDISKFKPVERLMLTKFIKHIQIKTNSSSCTDVPCLLNTAIGKSPESIEGHYLYLIYLNSGYFISLLSTSPDITLTTSAVIENGKLDIGAQHYSTVALPLTAPTQEELFKIVSLTYKLPNEMKNLININMIYRVDFNARMNDTSKTNCSKLGAKGDIILFDDCMENRADESLLRELVKGYNTYNQSQDKYSEKKRWTDLGKWVKEEGVYENYQFKYKHETRDEEFVSDLARHDPENDFRESLIAYIINPEKLKSVSFAKFQYFYNAFAGKSTDLQTVGASIARTVSNDLLSELEQIAKDCLSTGTDSQSHDTEFDLPIPDSPFKFCMLDSINKFIKKDIIHQKQIEISACDSFKIYENKISTSIKELSEARLFEILGKNENVANNLKTYFEFKNKVDEIDINSIVVKCSKPEIEDNEECFSTELENTFNVIAKDSTLSEKTIAVEKESLLNSFDYKSSLNDNLTHYKNLLSTTNDMIFEKVNDIYTKCKKSFDNSNSGIPVLYPFDGGSRYKINAGVLNCININSINEFPALMTKFFKSNSKTINKSEHKKFVFENIIYPQVNQLFTSKIESEIEKEEILLNSNLNNTGYELYISLNEDTSWIPKPYDKEKMMNNCIEIAEKTVLSKLENSESKFISKSQFANYKAQAICKSNTNDFDEANQKEESQINNKLIPQIEKDIFKFIAANKKKIKNKQICLSEIIKLSSKKIDFYNREVYVGWKFHDKSKVIESTANKACETVK